MCQNFFTLKLVYINLLLKCSELKDRYLVGGGGGGGGKGKINKIFSGLPPNTFDVSHFISFHYACNSSYFYFSGMMFC